MKIILLAFNGMTMFHLSTPLLVFREAARQDPQGQWQVTVVSLTGKDIETEDGLTVQVNEPFYRVERADWVVIPAWPVDLPDADVATLERLKNCIVAEPKLLVYAWELFLYAKRDYLMGVLPRLTGDVLKS